MTEEVENYCPDGGFCHHECPGACWRVDNCGPLSNVFVDDEWPDSVVRGNDMLRHRGEGHL